MTPTPIAWRKSSYSVNGSDCVELATTASGVLVRDSKHPDAGHLKFTAVAVTALVASAKAGELDDLVNEG